MSLEDEIYMHVGISEKISKSFVLKTKRVKEEKKTGASFETSSAEISLSKSASISDSGNDAQSNSCNVKQADSSDSHQSPKSLPSSESSSHKLKKKSASKGKELYKDSDSDGVRKQKANSAKLSTGKGKQIVTGELDFNFTVENEPSKEISKAGRISFTYPG